MGSQWGQSSVEFLKDEYTKLGYKIPSEVRVAVIYEDGAYGMSVSVGNTELSAKYGQTARYIGKVQVK